MPELAVDLGTPIFWCFFALAMFVLVPIVEGRVRTVFLAGLNLAFATLCVGRHGVPVLLAVIAGAYLAARAAHTKSLRSIAVAVGGLAILVLFLVHKLPSFALLPGARPVLAAIGFSYVALRLVELLRAMYDERQPVPSPFAVISYLLPFHMLAAGPIQSYDDFCGQPAVSERLTVPAALDGVERVASGLFKKFVIAQALQSVFLTGFTVKGPYLFVEAQIYYLWVYLDFSAYSDIAVGIGKLLGIATPENFANPLIARNLIDFWERWHISLSQFIRRNLFIPIQVALIRRSGGARPLAIASLAFVISFLLCGLWHGVSLRFLIWGGMHAAALVVTNLYKHATQKRLGRAGVKAYLAKRPVRAVATLLTFEFVAFSLMFIVYPFAGGS